ALSGLRVPCASLLCPRRASAFAGFGVAAAAGIICLYNRTARLQLLIAAVSAPIAYDFEANRGKTAHAKGILRACRKIDNPPSDEWAAVVNPHGDAAASALIADHHAGTERQRLMRCGDAHMVVSLAVCRLGSRRIGGGDTAFGKRLLAAYQ